MYAKELFFLSSLVLFAAVGSVSHNVGDIAAKFEKIRSEDFPEFKEHSQQDWIDIINSVRHGGPMPKDHSNYILNVIANTTGEWSDTEGDTATFSADARLHYNMQSATDFLRNIYDVRTTKVGDLNFVTVRDITTKYNTVSSNFSMTASILASATFEEINDTLVQVGDYIGFGQGETLIMDPNTAEFVEAAFLIENDAMISEVEYAGMVTVSGDHFHVDGVLLRDSIPLMSLRGGKAPRDPENLALAVRASKALAPPITVSEGLVTVDQYGAKDGNFSVAINSETFIYPAHTVNRTETFTSIFYEQNAPVENVQLYDFFKFIPSFKLP